MRARANHVPAIGPFHSPVASCTMIVTDARLWSCRVRAPPSVRIGFGGQSRPVYGLRPAGRRRAGARASMKKHTQTPTGDSKLETDPDTFRTPPFKCL